MTDRTDIIGDGRAHLSDRTDQRVVGAARLAIGLAQGLILYWLYRSAGGGVSEATATWPATQPAVFAPLLLVGAYLPVVALAGVGALRLRTLIIWLASTGAVLALVGWYDVARQALTPDATPPFLTFQPLPFIAAALFIAHHLIVPADRARRRIAGYPAYFDTAWKAGVQLALSLGFTGAFWILLFLGAALFNVIGLGWFEDLLEQEWFSIPLTCVVFAIAVQLTDVRDGLIRGVRSVALMLLSWLLPVLTVLTAGFLAALPFTGLDGLWETGSATALVLSAAGLLIILINTAYQDGREDNRPPRVLRLAAATAAILLTPLMIIAIWGLSLRIGQHGLTPDRIVAVACTVVGVLYALGYARAVGAWLTRRTAWMQGLEIANVISGVAAVAAILALFSPLADPYRLSVADQVARLERGAVAPDAFDYRFLRFDSGQAGRRALDRLTRSDDAEIARLAREARAASDGDRYSDRFSLNEPNVTPVIELRGDGQLAPDFLVPTRLPDPRAHCVKPGDCVGRFIERETGNDLLLLATKYNFELFARGDPAWIHIGTYTGGQCQTPVADPRTILRQGPVQTLQPDFPDIFVEGGRRGIVPGWNCRR